MPLHLPTDAQLITWQQQLEAELASFADTQLRAATARISDPQVHDAAAAYLIRPSKRLLGMAFLHAAFTLDVDAHLQDLVAVAAALEIRHGAILLHDDIVDGDTTRGGHPTAHHHLIDSFGATEAGSAALFAGDVLAGLAPLPILRCGLPASVRARLTDLFQHTTSLVAAGQTEQLHLDAVQDPADVTEADILRIHAGQFAPYLLCSVHLAAALAGFEQPALDRITEAGTPLCQGFQVQNDLAGFTELQRTLQSDQVLTLANTSDLARRRRTVLVRAAMDALPPIERDQLSDYLRGTDQPLGTIADLVDHCHAAAYCQALIADLHAQARTRISTDPLLPPEVRSALSATWGYMTALYDPASPVSRLYLQARTDLLAV